ncbi:hypothetical protein [Tenacibaculum singaporense]|uniref:Uncharacterized protein n=1 Tax=Tenacibaculum singaporense TaxID=2358479 RepID=A0A3Q8RS94_9FLAO|nr:hypothetical protein [Tenacibaculum singaporense]AZJ34394.1 hypothetical protein D6T69_02160 [Tenacibaculum singaporense]
MKKIEKIESFISFKISETQQSSILGSRSKRFESETRNEPGGSGNTYCFKVIDDNDGGNERKKFKKRYEGKC